MEMNLQKVEISLSGMVWFDVLVMNFPLVNGASWYVGFLVRRVQPKTQPAWQQLFV